MKIHLSFPKIRRFFYRHRASNARYMKNQMRDIEKYGEKWVPLKKDDPNLAKEIEEITPFRRRSERGTNLNEPLWHIQKFEEEKGAEYLPASWESMTVQEKADYVVADKYSNLVARKIMRRVKDEPLEHKYTLRRGYILEHVIGSETSVGGWDYGTVVGDTKIHNHPINIKIKNIKNEKARAFLEMICPGLYRTSCGFSGADIVSATLTRQKSYVIDSNGHIFIFEPKRTPIDPQEPLRYAILIRDKFSKVDTETNWNQSVGFAKLCAFILKQTGKNSQKDINEAVEFCKEYAPELTNVFVGQQREKLFQSKDFITKILDKVGKIWLD